MGTLNFLLGTGSTPRSPAPLYSPGSSLPTAQPARATKGIPERWNVNDWFDSASQGGASLFGAAGQLPSRIYETPFSIADTAAKRAFGFSPIEAVGKTPVGPVAGFLGGAVERAANVIPAFINSDAARIWGVVGNLPDSTVISPELLSEKLGPLGIDTPRTEGVPILSPLLSILGTDFFGRDQTVGEFRAELAKRGFFYDDEGKPVDPAGLSQDLQAGRRSAFAFGNRAVNDNALVDLGARITTDPTNLLFFVPGANLAKLGTLGAKLLPASRLIRAGQLAEKAPRAIAATGAIVEGKHASATLAGLSRVLSGYRKLAIGATVGNFTINRLGSVVNDMTDDELPLLPWIEEFTKAVEDRQPMSGNAAFMLFSAATFPYGHYVKGAVAAQRGARARVFGVGDMDAVYETFGGRDKFYEEVGGRAGERQWADFVDKQIARDERRLTPAEVANLQSIGDLGLRRRIEQQALERIVDRMRAKGEITDKMRDAKWKEFDAKEAGFRDKGISNPFDPTRSMRRWRDFEPAREVVDAVLRDRGEVIMGLRDDVVFTEQVDAARDVLRNARFTDDAGKSRVEVPAILDVLTDHPNINALDNKGYWARFGAPDAPAPSWDSISRRLARLRRESTKIEDYTAELADWERGAPADIEPTTIVPRAQRIEELRGQLSELESPTRAVEAAIARVGQAKELTEGIVSWIEPAEGRATGPAGQVVEFGKGNSHISILYDDDGKAAGQVYWANASLTSDGGILNLSVREQGRGFATKLYDELADVPGFTDAIARTGLTPSGKQFVGSWLQKRADWDRRQSVQRELSGLLAEEKAIHAARMEAHDAKTGADPEVGRQLDEALDSNDFIRPTRLSPGLERLAPEEIARVVALEKELLKINPSYRVKRAPEKEILALVPEDGAISVALRQHTALGEWLHQTGPFSPVSKFWNALTRKVTSDEMGTGAKRALMGEMIPLFPIRAKEDGTGPQAAATMEALLAELEQRVQDSIWIKAPGGFTVRGLRDIGSIMPGEVNRIAARYLPDQVVAKLEKQGGFYRVLARTGSRYFRAIDSKARKGDKGAVALRDIYRIWNDAPVLSSVAVTQRSIAKFVYPVFRFILDPRWLALNAIEANTLMFSKYGVAKKYKNMDEASGAARYFAANLDAETASSFSPDIGYSLGRELGLLTAKSFDVGSVKSVAAVIDEFGVRDPAVSALRSSLQREAKDTIAKVERQYRDGDITERTYLAERAKADKQLKSSSESLAEHVNDTLYRYETKGVDATVLEEARAILNADELRVMQPLIDRVTEVNRKTWSDIQLMLHGNPARSTMERLANSYWLLWPISYQIKATKWLANIMLNGSFGHNNNALLAGKYALWQEQHQERAKNNPAYAAMYAAHPSLWFAAQMLLPMSPEDIGVSLSKPASLAGTAGQRFLNDWLGTEIGAFTADKKLDDPSSAISWLTNMGMTYTFELWRRILNEADDGSIQQEASVPSIQPIPTTAGGQTSVPVR